MSFERILSEDLELFYTNLQNPERQPTSDQKFVHTSYFSTRKLTEEELTLLKNRNEDFLNTFHSYGSGAHPESLRQAETLDSDMRAIERSSDPESVFSCCSGHRHTIELHVTL